VFTHNFPSLNAPRRQCSNDLATVSLSDSPGHPPHPTSYSEAAQWQAHRCCDDLASADRLDAHRCARVKMRHLGYGSYSHVCVFRNLHDLSAPHLSRTPPRAPRTWQHSCRSVRSYDRSYRSSAWHPEALIERHGYAFMPQPQLQDGKSDIVGHAVASQSAIKHHDATEPPLIALLLRSIRYAHSLSCIRQLARLSGLLKAANLTRLGLGGTQRYFHLGDPDDSSTIRLIWRRAME
jgi:hypothetical protein